MARRPGRRSPASGAQGTRLGPAAERPAVLVRLEAALAPGQRDDDDRGRPKLLKQGDWQVAYLDWPLRGRVRPAFQARSHRHGAAHAAGDR
jgi:hypothetical protein